MVEETEHQFHAELQKQKIQRDLQHDIWRKLKANATRVLLYRPCAQVRVTEWGEVTRWPYGQTLRICMLFISSHTNKHIPRTQRCGFVYLFVGFASKK
jgi:hypothetical protein